MKDVNKALIMGLILAGCSYPIKIAVEPNQFKAQKLETKLNIAKAESNLKICSWM